MPLDGQKMRTTLLETVRDLSQSRNSALQQSTVLTQASEELGIRGSSQKDAQEGLLTLWYDLFREGYLSWGSDMASPNPPFCHLSERGRAFLAHVSYDPANPGGYLHYLAGRTHLNPVAQSYIEEAIKTYNTMCYKATAVMVGAAAESVALDVRDAFVQELNANNVMGSLPKSTQTDLVDWRIKRVLDAIEQVVDHYHKQKRMVKELYEAFSSNWPPFTGQIRTIRNDAGHPKSVNPVTAEDVHAALLIFPHQARLGASLTAWAPTGIT